MVARGRPTPQRPTDERPRFRDPATSVREEVNPYIRQHRHEEPYVLPADQAWTWRDRWAERFGRTAPLCLEIGPGNGDFLTELAVRNPDVDHVGVEIRYKRVVLSAIRMRKAGVTNAVVCRYHAAFLDDLFPPASLSTIWVNHPDPWPKGRHDKNRLISRWFLEDVVRLLVPGGVFRLKSDFRANVDRAVALLDGLPLEVTGRAEDVTTGPAPWADDIETNYQHKFRIRGLPVYAVELTRT